MSDNTVNAIPPALNDLLVKLRFISLIKPGLKVNLGTMSFTTGKSYLSRVKRHLAGEKRTRLMIHLNQIVADAIKAIEEYHNTEFCRIVVNHLAEAKTGIANLSTTYAADPNIYSQIAVCLANIAIQLDKHRHLLAGHTIMTPETNPPPNSPQTASTRVVATQVMKS